MTTSDNVLTFPNQNIPAGIGHNSPPEEDASLPTLGVRLTKWQFERLVFEGRIGALTKLVALAILQHMGADKAEADPSIARIAYMCNLDQRTVQRHVRLLAAELGLVVTARLGKRNKFELPVIASEAAVEDLFRKPAFRDAVWSIFRRQRSVGRPDQFSDIEQLTADVQAFARAKAGGVAAASGVTLVTGVSGQ